MKSFIKELKTFLFIVVFVFLLTVVNVWVQSCNQILTAAIQEPVSYVEIIDKNYDSVNMDLVKGAMESLAEYEDVASPHEIYVLDKNTKEIVSTDEEVPSAVEKELLAKINEKRIIIDGYICKVAETDHYKILVKVDARETLVNFAKEIVVFAGFMFLLFIFASILLFLNSKFIDEHKKIRSVIGMLIILCLVFIFIARGMNILVDGLNTTLALEKKSLYTDAQILYDLYYRDGSNGNAEYSSYEEEFEATADFKKLAETTNIDEIAMTLAKNSSMLKSIERINEGSEITGDVKKDLAIIEDTNAIENEKVNYYLQGLLLLLLTFILMNENFKKQKYKLENNKDIENIVTVEDKSMRFIVLVIAITTSSFNIVNVLRMKQVAMLYFDTNVSSIINTIFTFTMVMSMVGSIFASAIFKSFGNIKTYSIVAYGLLAAGAIMTGSMNVFVLFIIGLIIYNVGLTMVSMVMHFYLGCKNVGKTKDACYMELSNGSTIGQTIGVIVGGVMSTVLSYSATQIMAGGIAILSVVLVIINIKSNNVSAPKEKLSVKNSFISVLKIITKPEALFYTFLFILPATLPYTFTRYRLPLDVAALGMTTVLYSFLKTLEKFIGSLSNGLYSVVSKKINSLQLAIIYIVLEAVAIAIYIINGSVVSIIIFVVMIGILDGIGYYSIVKNFKELPEIGNIPESDRSAGYSFANSAMSCINPTIISTLSNSIALPGFMIACPFIYLFINKNKKTTKG